MRLYRIYRRLENTKILIQDSSLVSTTHNPNTLITRDVFKLSVKLILTSRTNGQTGRIPMFIGSFVFNGYKSYAFIEFRISLSLL